ncbi:hypothetical protein [Endozoicomonas acroporae]|uniref:hypothetical protein n=1 Tax=Endozoicomonas acroporae TaxID=1701104 RepID=UPI0013D400C1|nr:hypothetical protein [Endozoicomonas acroporae]
MTTVNVLISEKICAMGLIIVVIIIILMSGKIYALRTNVKSWSGLSAPTKSALNAGGPVTGEMLGMFIWIVVMVPMRGRKYALRTDVRS